MISPKFTITPNTSYYSTANEEGFYTKNVDIHGVHIADNLAHIKEMTMSVVRNEPLYIPTSPWDYEDVNRAGVYFIILHEWSRVKIGCSKCISTRIKNLESKLRTITGGGVATFDLYAIKPCSDIYETERLLHLKFSGYQISHEWFELSTDLIMYMNFLKMKLEKVNH